MNSENLRRSLDSAGLNLFSVLDSGATGDVSVPPDCQSVLLIGHSGDALWQQMPASYLSRRDPVDEYTADTVARLLKQHCPGNDWKILFPSQSPANAEPNLQNLGRLAGWHNASPLGNGIHPRYGLWFAYRAVVALNENLLSGPKLPGNSPCISCEGTPCIAACPADALSFGAQPDLKSCVEYRSAQDSVCADRCVARLRCPVAAEWRYSDQQIKYFYGRSLPSLQEWVAGHGGPASVD